MIEVRVPIKTINGLNERAHWSVKAKRAKAERHAVGWALSCTDSPALPCLVLITREGMNRRLMDGDGLQSAAKHVRDAVADWLGVDDSDRRITWAYDQTPNTPYAVRIRVKAE